MILMREGNWPLKTKQNPPTKTNKDDREPLWLLTLRTTNNIVTSNIISEKTSTLHSKKHNFTQFPYLRKEKTHTFEPMSIS
jgi:hypothetical protein